MSNLSVRMRIVASFAIVIFIVLLVAGLTFDRLTTIASGAGWISTTAVPGILNAAKIRTVWVDHMLDTQARMIDVLDRRDQPVVDPLADRFPELNQRLAAALGAHATTIDASEERRLHAELLQSRDRYLALHEQWRELVARVEYDQAERILGQQLRPEWAAGRTILDQLVSQNESIVGSAITAIEAAVAISERVLLVSAVLAILAAAGCGILLLRVINRPISRIVAALDDLGGGNLMASLDLRRKDEFNAIENGFNRMVVDLRSLVGQAQRSSVQMTTAVTGIAAASKQQQSTASETVATTMEIGATSREIAATARDLVRTMTEVSATAEQTSALAGSGQHGLARMEEIMHQVTGAAEVVTSKLAILNDKAGHITQMVTTIVKVSDQTNLLSLNAAIEAEKAGEYGRGFSVVASEVRRLADQTAVASYDIDQMVRDIQSAVSAGVMGMDKFSEEVRRGLIEMSQVGRQLSQIILQVQELAPRILTVNEGMEAQAAGAEQINEALVQLGEASGQTAEALRQAGFAIDELNQVASGMRSSVSRFKV